MKILIFSPYYPPHIGGLESHADEFNKYLSQKDSDIVVFTPRLPKESPEIKIKYNKVKIIRFPAFEIISNYPVPKFWKTEFWKLFFNLFNEDYDIVISRTRFFNTSLLAFIYAKIKKRVKWIHIEHGSDFVRLSSNFKTFIAKFYDYTLGWIIFKYSDKNISISKAVQKFVYKFDKRESPIIYRGLETKEIDKIKPNQKIKNEYSNKTIISFAGRLYEWKGVENSIKAIQLLPQIIKNNLIFLIIGDGEDYLKLEKLSKNEASIKMLGKMSRKEVISILKVTDIYLHSAKPGGGLSTSLLEAMYCECAIIATLNEGASEIIKNEENGLLINSSDSKLIAGKLEKLLCDRNKIKMLATNAKNDVQELFSWEKTISAYLNYLK
ncbi:MAG: hypothetical protein ACD_11C00018G0030 [uncultured bacterium]|nr:MAG: hypothetical protein ACD_11C00018G0030 [uncultured bacterium]HBR71556.1 glycosyltransferase [Candidatus Moranbacteria bacterium]